MDDNKKEFIGYMGYLPATLRYDKELTANAKILFIEISALTNAKGYCWAENLYFQEFFGVQKGSIIRWLNELEERGYIKRVNIYKDKQVVGRHIYINLNSTTPYEISNEGCSKNRTPPGSKNRTSIPINKIKMNNNNINIECAPVLKTSKQKYGEYKNVLLAADEHSKLIAEPDGIEAIEFLSAYIAEKPYKSKSHYLAIRRWVLNAVAERANKKGREQNTKSVLDPLLKAAQREMERGNANK